MGCVRQCALFSLIILRSSFVLTLDAGLSGPVVFIRTLWQRLYHQRGGAYGQSET